VGTLQEEEEEEEEEVVVVEGSRVNRAQPACLQTRHGLTTTRMDQAITPEHTKRRSQSALAVEAVLVCRAGHACADSAFLDRLWHIGVLWCRA
jgi:hypothetical protein